MSKTPYQNRDLVTEHLEVLRHYARKSLVEGQKLSRLEKVDKTIRLDHFRTIGRSFQLTGSEMTRLIFKGLFRGPRFCGCPTCQARRADLYDTASNDNGQRRPFFGQQGPHE